MADNINIAEKVMDLVDITGKLSVQVDNINQKINEMSLQMTSIQSLVKNDTVQDKDIADLQKDMNGAHEKLREVEARVVALEQSGAQKAKAVLLTIAKYVGVAIIGAIIANAKEIIQLLFK